MSDPLSFLLPNSALTRYRAFDLAGFLARLNSPLLQVVTPEGPAVTLIDQVAREVGLDPRVLLTRLQVEQSLVTQPATPERLDWAFGYGVPDGGPRDEHYRGFARQLRAAAETLKSYMEPGTPLSVVDLVGKPMTVSDGTVVPANRATAALFRYTPWRGDAPAAGLQPPFGNALWKAVWEEFFGPPAREDPGGWRLITPPDRWREPLEVSAEVVAAVQAVAQRLSLRLTVDTDTQKVYLGLPEAPAAAPRPPVGGEGGPVYPSGFQATLAHLSAAEAARYRPAHSEVAAPLVVADPHAQLSPHFTMGEFVCHDPSYTCVRVAPALVQLLEDLRHALGDVPLQINSSYRPPAYNAAIGGASQSVHMDGLAADVSANVPFAQLAAAAERLVGSRGGLGLYPSQGFVHTDLLGKWARWP